MTLGMKMPAPFMPFVSAPVFQWPAFFSTTPSFPLRDLARQSKQRELDVWRHAKSETRPAGKPAIGTRTRKCGGSMEHLSSAGQGRSGLSNEAKAVATNGFYKADFRLMRRSYRGKNAVEREAVALRHFSSSEPDRVLDDRVLDDKVLTPSPSQNNIVSQAATGPSFMDERAGQTTPWLEGSDQLQSMDSVWSEQASYSKHWNDPAADIDRAAPSQGAHRPHQTSLNTLQRKGSYLRQAAFDGDFSVHGESRAMSQMPASADLYAEGFVQSDVSKHSRPISRSFEHTSNGFGRRSSQNAYANEIGGEPSLASSYMELEWSESRPLRDGAYSNQCCGKLGSHIGENVAGRATGCGSPQKSVVQSRHKKSYGCMNEVDSDSVTPDADFFYGRQEYYAISKQSTQVTDVKFNRKPARDNAIAQKSNFECGVNEKDSIGSSSWFSSYHPNEALNGGQSVPKKLVDLHLSENQTRQTQITRPNSIAFSQNQNNPGMSVKQASRAEELNGKPGSSWLQESEKIKARRMQVAACNAIARADSQHKMQYRGPASGSEELLAMNKQGIGNTVGMSTLKIGVSNSVPQVQKVEHVVVEKDSLSESSITRQVEDNRDGLPELNVARSNGAPQVQSEKPERGQHHPDSTRRASFRINEMVTSAVCSSDVNSNKSAQLQFEKPLPDLADKKGKILSAGEGGFGFSCENIHLQHCSVGEAKKETRLVNGKHVGPDENEFSACSEAVTGFIQTNGDDIKAKLNCLYKNIFIVDKVETAKMVVAKLRGEYQHLIHACDTEVANIDVKKESPVGHGSIICFSIYCGPEADFGEGKSCVWVDVLDGGEEVLKAFAPYFEDSSIQKVWHNYSFDNHILGNHGINVCGFHADTMHLARLWNSARRGEGGYSLEALTKDPKVMDGAGTVGEGELIAGKVSMKTIFGKKKVKKDGSEGKIVTIAPVEELQRTERVPWICYSALDSISTLRLWTSLRKKLMCRDWVFQGVSKGNMYDFYEEYWRPFGELLVQMESTGMLVDRKHLSEMEKVAIREQEISASRFRKWASKYCPDARYMNVSSDTQVRQLLFGGMPNKKDPSEFLPLERTLKAPNVDNFIEEGKKAPTKYRNIVLRGLGVHMEVETYTLSGWPAVTGTVLKRLAGNVSVDYDSLVEDVEDEFPADIDEVSVVLTSAGVKIGETTVGTEVEVDSSVYGTAYHAFGGGRSGREACHAIAALCEVSSINTLISNFLQPLQENQISGQDGRVHCSININTETGRLSARRPNLQNQPALEKDRYKIRQAFIADPGNTLIVADYGQLELRILAHLSNCKSMLDAFRAGGDFHSRTAVNMYAHVREAVENDKVLLEWDPQPGEEKPPVPLLKDVFGTERRKAKMLNFSIAYGKTAVGLSKDWKVSLKDAKETVNLWYNGRQEVLEWQEERKHEAHSKQCVHTLLGRARHFPNSNSASPAFRGHIERAAINTPVQGSAADVAMLAMLEIARNARLKELGWKLLLQVHDEVILEGPIETAEEAKSLVVNCMSYPFYGKNILSVDLAVDAKYGLNWYAAK